MNNIKKLQEIKKVLKTSVREEVSEANIDLVLKELKSNGYTIWVEDYRPTKKFDAKKDVNGRLFWIKIDLEKYNSAKFWFDIDIGGRDYNKDDVKEFANELNKVYQLLNFIDMTLY